ncbi:MAG TPA: hypothetical protein VFS30_00700 [Dehalococcoidia bacterium]|nr:hypothetical protein [Dehalococcoidia bacterium]
MAERALDEPPSRFSERDIEFLDHLLQDMFGLGLKLEYCLLVLDEAPAQARVGMEDVVSGLEGMVDPIRAQILKLGRSRNLSQESTDKDRHV